MSLGNNHHAMIELQKLLVSGKAQMLPSGDPSFWLVKIDGLSFHLEYPEEIFILREVFVNQLYADKPSQPYIAIDIGMNIGTSSLYFASDPLCQKVFGFEPFEPTYNRALLNFQLNAQLMNKIDTYKIGLGSHDRDGKAQYCPDYKGRMSTSYTTQGIPADHPRLNHLDFKVCDASQIVSRLIDFASSQDYQILMKIDCEGAEYEILPQLSHSGLLSQIDIVQMEWHFKGSTPLTEILVEDGFQVREGLKTDTDSEFAGMIYATRNDITN